MRRLLSVLFISLFLYSPFLIPRNVLGAYVTGPSSSVDNHPAIFSGTSGSVIKDNSTNLGCYINSDVTPPTYGKNIPYLGKSVNSGPGVVGWSQTSNLTNSGNQCTQGVSGYVQNNNSSYLNTCYAGYFEARRTTNAGITQGVEVDIINQENTTPDVTCSSTPNKSTIGLWISSGRNDLGSVYDSSCAIGILNNGARFRRGIVIQNNSIAALPNGELVGILIPNDVRISFGSDDRSLVYSSSAGRMYLTDNLTVQGTVDANCGTLTCDYVFDNGYKLMSLDNLNKYVRANKKLPKMTINKGGTYSSAILREQIVEKLEEQTLYILQLHKQIKQLEKRI